MIQAKAEGKFLENYLSYVKFPCLEHARKFFIFQVFFICFFVLGQFSVAHSSKNSKEKKRIWICYHVIQAEPIFGIEKLLD